MSSIRRPSARADLWFAVLVFALVLFGIMMIYSAGVVSAETLYHNQTYFVTRQLIYVAIGAVLWIATQNIDYHHWRRFGLWLFIISLLLLIPLALHITRPINGAFRWYDLKVFSLQPTEPLKLGFVMYLAALFERRLSGVATWREGFIPFFGALILVALFVMRQPDLGTLLVLVAIGFSIYYAAGAKLIHLLAGVGLLALLVVLLIKVEPYRMARLQAFLNPSADVQNTGYHNRQALIAIGSGGLFGRGFGQSIQKHNYLPEPETDSIFAVTVEELGFLRSTLVIALYALLAWRGIHIANQAEDRFGQLVAVGLVVWLIGQALLNIAAMLGLVPLTGVPLPFISYGGSSLLVNLTAVGILLSISKSKSTPTAYHRGTV